MFGEDDDIFDVIPDLDLDGDHDLVDALILDDILTEEENLTTKKPSVTLERFHVKSSDEEDIFFEYGIDPDDYLIREEYEEAVFEAKYGWRDLIDISESIELNVDPDDFETEEEYLDAIEQARSGETSALEIKINVSLGNSDAEYFDYDQNLLNMDGVAFRHAYAEQKIKTFDPEFDTAEEKARYLFIVKGEVTAAKYLTVDGVYLYAQAIKDHFKLPFDIPDEKDEIATHFETLLQDLVEDNPKQGIKIWEWCIDTFMPYIQYAGYKEELIHGILLDMGNFIDEFPTYIVEHMIENPAFIEKTILQCTDSLWGIADFVTIALKAGRADIALTIMQYAFANPHTDVHDKVRFVEDCINECSNWEELETMESFKEHIFPIVYQETDVRIKNKVSRWEKSIEDYIESIEEDSEKYQYSRKYAWRAKYQNAEVSPLRYEMEDEYLAAVEEHKYRWRKYCSNRVGISPMDFETREEYDKAVSEAYAKEREERDRARASDPTNTTLYKFCKVSVNFPNKPYYYYLTGRLKLRTGDRVVVPFGNDNKHTEGVVMAVGECYGSAFPCKVEHIKTVIAIAVPDLKRGETKP